MTLVLHVHLHARSIRRHAQTARESVDRSRDVGRRGLEGLIDNLESAINRLDWKPAGTEWADYEEVHGYSTEARSEKERVVLEMLKDESPRVVWDLGSNTGRFSEVAASVAEVVVSMDGDPAAVEILYQRLKQRGSERILPLWVDLTNPSPALGWAHEERYSLLSRGPADTILALALIHHLAISNNLPLESIARLFRGLGRHLIIEFVPKTDSQAQRLLVSREDIFSDYSRAAFEHTFSRYFKTIRSSQLGATDRWIYSMVRIEQ
jgi:ribosomal protein L11 methylase PrmA